METTFSGLSVGMKIYDNDWFLTHQLEPEQAVDVLKAMGVTWLIAQSRFLPMADSAVDSAVRKSDRERYASLDDVAFRRALKDRGIAYFAVLNICFDPAFAARHPELLPVDQFGRRAETQDWYIGLPPNREENLRHKIGLLERAVAALDPDAGSPPPASASFTSAIFSKRSNRSLIESQCFATAMSSRHTAPASAQSTN